MDGNNSAIQIENTGLYNSIITGKKFPCQRAQIRWMVFKCLYLWRTLAKTYKFESTEFNSLLQNYSTVHRLVLCSLIRKTMYGLVYCIAFCIHKSNLHISFDTHSFLAAGLMLFCFAPCLYPLSLHSFGN